MPDELRQKLRDAEVELQATRDALPPIGSIIAWHPNLASVPAPTLPGGWVLCDGRAIKVGPFAGSNVPDLNGQRRFLRGADRSGAIEVDALQGHGHDASGTYRFYRDCDVGGEPEFDPNNRHGLVKDTPGLASNRNSSVEVSVQAPTGARIASETRPINMAVVWIMRIF